MTARLTQQIIAVAYNVDAVARVSAVAVEVIRSTAAVPLTASGKTQVTVVAG